MGTPHHTVTNYIVLIHKHAHGHQVALTLVVGGATATITETARVPGLTVTLADMDLIDALARSGAIPSDAHRRIVTSLTSMLGGESNLASTASLSFGQADNTQSDVASAPRVRARRQVLEAKCTNLQDDLWHYVFVYAYTGMTPNTP